MVINDITPEKQETLHFDQDLTQKEDSPRIDDTLLICDYDDQGESKIMKVDTLLSKGSTKALFGKLEDIKENQIIAKKNQNITNININELVNSFNEQTSTPDSNDTFLICDNIDKKNKKIKTSTLLSKGDTSALYGKVKDFKETQTLSYKSGHVTNVDIKDLVNINGFIFKHSVDTVVDLAIAFPNPQLGWAALVKKDDLSHVPDGVLYVYTSKEDGSANDWIKFDIMRAPYIIENLDMNNFNIKNAANIYCNSFIAKDYSPILEQCYPIGSIYINASSDLNPHELLGFGTWKTFAEGRNPIGVNNGDELFNVGEKTGGKTDAILPKHTHITKEDKHTHFIASTENIKGWGEPDSTDLRDQRQTARQYLAASRGENSGKFTPQNYGLGASNNYPTCGSTSTDKANILINEIGIATKNANLQPYITVYMWKRIS